MYEPLSISDMGGYCYMSYSIIKYISNILLQPLVNMILSQWIKVQ